MGTWWIERRLSQTSSRLVALRSELAQIDEQLMYVADEADDQELRAMVSETPLASHDANDARKHADALSNHRRHVLESIHELERRQDELLDKLTAKR